MSRKATAKEVYNVCRHMPQQLLQALSLSIGDAQLSLPIEGKIPRIRVSVRPGQSSTVPNSIEFNIGSDIVELTIEVNEDYQEYELQSDFIKVY